MHTNNRTQGQEKGLAREPAASKHWHAENEGTRERYGRCAGRLSRDVTCSPSCLTVILWLRIFTPVSNKWLSQVIAVKLEGHLAVSLSMKYFSPLVSEEIEVRPVRNLLWKPMQMDLLPFSLLRILRLRHQNVHLYLYSRFYGPRLQFSYYDSQP